MAVKVKMQPTSKIKARLGINPGGKAQQCFTNTCHRYMTKYVPGGTKSHLNQNVNIGVDTITYTQPGAHYLYTGKLYVDPKSGKGAMYSPNFGFWSRPNTKKVATSTPLNYHTPGTGAHWDKLMWTAEGKEAIKEVEKYIARGGK